jgi:hypothetical protein
LRFQDPFIIVDKLFEIASNSSRMAFYALSYRRVGEGLKAMVRQPVVRPWNLKARKVEIPPDPFSCFPRAD